MIFEGHYHEVDGTFRAELVVSPKFDLVAYLRSFPHAAYEREAQAEVRELVAVIVMRFRWSVTDSSSSDGTGAHV